VTVTGSTTFTCAVELNAGAWVSGGSVTYTNAGRLLAVENQNRFTLDNVHVSGGTTCWVGGLQVSEFSGFRCTGMALDALTFDPSSILTTSTLLTGKSRFGDSRGSGIRADNATIWVGPGAVIENNQGYGVEVAAAAAATVSLSAMHIEGNRHGFGRIGVGLASGYGWVTLNDALLFAEYPAVDSPSYGWEIDRGGLTVQHVTGSTGYNVNVFPDGFATCTANSKPLRLAENIENGFSFGAFPFAPTCTIEGWKPGNIFAADDVEVNGLSVATGYVKTAGSTMTGPLGQTGTNPVTWMRGSGTPALVLSSYAASGQCWEIDSHSSGELRFYSAAGSSSDGPSGCTNAVTLRYKFAGGNFLSAAGTVINNAITSLTGDVTATGPGGVSATLVNSGVSAGTYGTGTQSAVITFDSKGRATSATQTTINGGATGTETFSASCSFTPSTDTACKTVSAGACTATVTVVTGGSVSCSITPSSLTFTGGFKQ
jgi:hypothetical protein